MRDMRKDQAVMEGADVKSCRSLSSAEVSLKDGDLLPMQM